jgi:phosphate starvation-inducible PhoH-like protein
MQQPARKTRKEKAQAGTQRVIKEKFMEQREEAVKSKPLVAMNSKQQEYIDLLDEKPVVIATGWAGTSKSYIPAVMAADLYKLGQIDRIMLTRPAISNSQSLGFFKGSETEKLSVWLGSVLPIFKDRLGTAMFELAVSTGDITFVPLEVVKGLSLNRTFFICEEASDLTKDEVIKLITRMGKESTLVLAGDILQSELKEDSGLVWLTEHLEKHTNLKKNFGWVDFDSVDHIVRSQAVKDFIVSLIRDNKKN